MTNQEALNKVWDYFVVQGHPQAKGEFGCWYRTPGDGRKCAVGCLIPDSDYFPEMESAGLRKVISMVPALGGVNPTLLRRMQGAHDSGGRADSFSGHMEGRLSEIAANYGLSVPTSGMS